jgi:hypothetical protein
VSEQKKTPEKPRAEVARSTIRFLLTLDHKHRVLLAAAEARNCVCSNWMWRSRMAGDPVLSLDPLKILRTASSDMPRYTRIVKIATGTVTNGQIVIEGESFSEGEKVTVLSYDEQSPFRVTPEEKRMLLESIAQADRGEFVDLDQLLAELDESN